MLMRFRHVLLAGLLAVTSVVTTSAQYYLGNDNHGVSLSGFIQGDFTSRFGKDVETQNSFFMRRAIFVANAQITDRWTALAVLECSKGFKPLDVLTQYSFSKGLNIKVGQFKSPVGWENQFSPATNELLGGSIVTNYIVGSDLSNPYYYGNTGRDIGMELNGELFRGLVAYRLDLLNGSGINRMDNNAEKSFGGSLTIRPFEGLALNGSALYGKIDYQTNVAGKAIKENRLQAGGAVDYRHQYFDMRGEALFLRMGDIKTQGYSGTAVAHVCSYADLVGAYEYLSYDKDSYRSNIVGGVAIHLNKRCKLSTQYIYDLTANKALDTRMTAHNVLAQLQVML